MEYTCTDGNGDMVIEAQSHREAAQEWVDTGDWGNDSKTQWIDVRVTDEDGDSQSITITLEPDAPQCADGGDAHDWASPHSLLGGLRENPGVQGNGGGVVVTEVCRCCGCYRITDTWAQRSDTGEQGLESLEYRDADEASIAWLDGQQSKWEQWVRDNSDDDSLPEDRLERAFIAIFRRGAGDDDRKNGLWSLLCQAVPREENAERGE